MRFVWKILALVAALSLPVQAFALDLEPTTRDPAGRFSTPRGLTPGFTDNSRRLATTEFVQALASATVVSPYLSDTHCGADQTDRINRLSASLPAGAWLIFPRSGCIAISGTLLNVKQRWSGAGLVNGTEFRYSGATGTAIKLMGDGALFEHARVANNGFTSSSTGIVMSDASENPTHQGVENVYTTGFTTAINVESGYFWAIRNVWVRNYAKYGVLVRNGNYCDNGDSSIEHLITLNDFAPLDGSAGIRFQSGGGLKITNSKLLGSQYGVDLQLEPTCNMPGTGILLVSNTSIENQTVAAVRLGAAPGLAGASNPKIFGSISISGNEIAGQPTAIRIDPGVYNVNVTGNVFNIHNYDVQVFGGENVYIGGNTHKNFNVAAIDLHDGGSNIVVGPAAYSPVSLSSHRVLDQRLTDTGPVDRFEQRPLHLAAPPAQGYTPSAPGYVPAFQIDMRPNRATRATIQIEGTLQGVGTVSSYQDVLLTNTGLTATITPTSPPVTAANPIDLAYDTTTVPGSVIVQVRTNAPAGGNGFDGSISARVNGPAVGFKVLQ
ncbi:hypothetical protein [Methylobacterium mesophilicum]|uniref:hypothetical protein n=1 Tax=Methylobacterium mesophilicum TaxID=39956 RepID=UPI002F2F37B4